LPAVVVRAVGRITATLDSRQLRVLTPVEFLAEQMDWVDKLAGTAETAASAVAAVVF
jgi:hypothetical protein